MEISVMCEALKRQIGSIDRKNETLQRQIEENECEIERIYQAIAELERTDKQCKNLGLTTDIIDTT